MQPPLSRETREPCNRDFECNGLWLLKNSLPGKRSKKLCARMPYKRRSRFSWTFSIPQVLPVLRKMDFFNTHACLQQLAVLVVK